MNHSSMPLQSFDERLLRVQLWPLPLLLLVSLAAWKLLCLRFSMSDDTYRAGSEPLLHGLALGWWLLKAAPRPYSVRAVVGRPLDLRGWGLVAVALFGVSCLRIVWWLAPLYSDLVKAATTGVAFPISTKGVAPELFAILWVVVVGPIVEELVNRGTVFRKWRVRWGPVTALLLSSVVFCAPHTERVASFLTGLTYVLLYTRTRSLWASVAMHVLNNGALYGVAVLSYLWEDHKTIRLVSLWQYGAFALVLLLGVATWVGFVVKSWRTLGDPLPPDSLQGDPVAPLSSFASPLRVGS